MVSSNSSLNGKNLGFPCVVPELEPKTEDKVTNMELHRSIYTIRGQNFQVITVPERQGSDGLPSEQW